jgi:nitroimidazol reductase NimA-like FMN-containing flavoprotein (pyridoxamine 5'-phosphate oxidase superfamily)
LQVRYESLAAVAINTRNHLILLLGKVTFSRAEHDFLIRNEACRIATCHDNIPHVVPVSYVFEDGAFYIATDYETRKYKNIRENSKIALVVDTYSSLGNKAVCVQGIAQVIESGSEFVRLYKIFQQRFEWVRRDPWSEGEAPFIRVIPTNKVSWGLK